jgi:hypothetical protein
MICRACGAENGSTSDSCFRCGQSLFNLTEGAVVASRYEIKSLLGRGGMGMVYKAHDRELDEQVALKVLRAEIAGSPEMARRFRSEIKLARRVRHRNVCGIHEYGQDGHLRFIAMEFVDGIDLKRLMVQRGFLPPEEAFDVVIQVAAGLQAIHEAGVVHRDLKTPNIMRDASGVVRLMDFGLAKQFGVDETSGATATGTIVGTPEYMSPEQARGEKIDGRSDLYSLGIVVFEIFTGNVPFHGDTPLATIFKHLETPPPLDGPRAARIPPALIPVLARALEKDRERRIPTAAEMSHALQDAQRKYSARVTGTPRPIFTAVATDTREIPQRLAETAPLLPTPVPAATPMAAPLPVQAAAPTLVPVAPPKATPVSARAATPIPAAVPLKAPSPVTPPLAAAVVPSAPATVLTPVPQLAPSAAAPEPLTDDVTAVASRPSGAESPRPPVSPQARPRSAAGAFEHRPAARPRSRAPVWFAVMAVAGVAVAGSLLLFRGGATPTAEGPPVAVLVPPPVAPATQSSAASPASNLGLPGMGAAQAGTAREAHPAAVLRGAEPTPVARVPGRSEPQAVPFVRASESARVTAPATNPPTTFAAASPVLPPLAEAPRAEPAGPAAVATAPAQAAQLPGLLHVVVRPWAEVFVDGVSRGTAPPLRPLSLPAGEHLVRLEHPDYKPFARKVRVVPGETVKLNVDWSWEGVPR